MVEVTYSMLAWTAVLLFQAIVQYLVRSDNNRKEQQHKQHEEPTAAEEQPPPLQQQHDQTHQQQLQTDGNESLSVVSLSGRESDDSQHNSEHPHDQHREPVSPASVFYVSFDDDGCEIVKDDNKKNTISSSSSSSDSSDCGLRYRQKEKSSHHHRNYPFNLPPEYFNSSTNSSDESEESLVANEPKDFHKLLSQTGSEMMKSCLSIEDMVQEQINHE